MPLLPSMRLLCVACAQRLFSETRFPQAGCPHHAEFAWGVPVAPCLYVFAPPFSAGISSIRKHASTYVYLLAKPTQRFALASDVSLTNE
jgi:hypothetical protein